MKINIFVYKLLRQTLLYFFIFYAIYTQIIKKNSMESESSAYKKFEETATSPDHPIIKEDSFEPETPTPKDIEDKQNPPVCCTNPESSIKSYNNYPSLSDLQNPSDYYTNPENFMAPACATENFVAPNNAMESGPSIYQNPEKIDIPPSHYIKVENSPTAIDPNPPEPQKIEEKKKKNCCKECCVAFADECFMENGEECFKPCFIACMHSLCTCMCKLLFILLVDNLTDR